jgi:hypothetical protein
LCFAGHWHWYWFFFCRSSGWSFFPRIVGFTIEVVFKLISYSLISIPPGQSDIIFLVELSDYCVLANLALADLHSIKPLLIYVPYALSFTQYGYFIQIHRMFQG